MTATEIAAILGSVLLALIGVVWGMLRSDIADLKGRVVALEKEGARLATEHARSEERDKAFEKGIDRLTKAIDDFDTRIGQKIEALSRALDVGIRKHSPPSGTPATRYKCIPNDDEGKK